MMLEIRNVEKNFGETCVLDGISFDVDRSDVVAILGPSGSGKTTLLRCLNFLEKADSGTMMLLLQSQPLPRPMPPSWLIPQSSHSVRPVSNCPRPQALQLKERSIPRT